MFYRSRNKSIARPSNNHHKNQAPTSTGALEKHKKTLSRLSIYRTSPTKDILILS